MKHFVGKMKFLAIKLSALQSEVEISKQILESAGREVDKMFKEKYFPELAVTPEEDTPTEISQDLPPDPGPEQPIGPHSDESQPEYEDEVIETKKKKTDPDVNKLFKKISLLIHPDKLVGIEDGYEKNNKEQLYLKAIRAKEENDLIILADIAIQLGIDPPEISREKLKIAENKINDIKKELKHIESTFVWQWFFCSNDDQKNSILERLFEIMYERKK
jgi:hypothetical protein